MENIRLPENFTDQVMKKIEERERARARRARAITVAGGIFGGILISAAALIAFRHYGTALIFPDGAARFSDILNHITGLFSTIITAVHRALAIQAGPIVSISLAVFLLAIAGLWHDRHCRRHDYQKTIR